MAYDYGGWNQYPAQSSARNLADWPGLPAAQTLRGAPAIQLTRLVVALGLATYVVNYAVVPPAGSGWGVRLATSAAVVAAADLLARQGATTKLIAAAAVMGFLEAASQLITGSQHFGWAGIAIVVLIGLQALAAIAALVTSSRESGVPDRLPSPYDVYAYYAQAAHQYYAANHQPPQQQPEQAQGSAQAGAAATAGAQQAMSERDALYAEYLSVQQAGRGRAAMSPPAGERTHDAAAAPGSGLPMTGSAQSIRPPTDPTGGSATQSFS